MRRYRRRRRLAGHDYAEQGYYFVTFCTRRREQCLSQIVEGEVRLMRDGRCVAAMLEGMAARFAGMRLCSAVVMPDHVHLLVEIHTQSGASLHTLLRWLKAGASRRAGRPLWQLGSYDSVVRSARGVERVTRYIALNPQRWADDAAPHDDLWWQEAAAALTQLDAEHGEVAPVITPSRPRDG